MRSYVQRTQAEIDTKRVAGVHAVANDLEVHLPSRDVRPDPEIARDCVTQLEFDLPTSHEQVKLIVENGWVSLEGSVIWNFQRERAEEAVRHIRGVTGVSNFIEVKPKVPATEIREKIESALSRIAVLDASRITVETQGGVVKLHGVVHSWAERAAQNHFTAIGLDGDAVGIHFGAPAQGILDLAPDGGGLCFRPHRDQIRDTFYAAHAPHGLLRVLSRIIPFHAAFERDPAVLHHDLHVRRGER